MKGAGSIASTMKQFAIVAILFSVAIGVLAGSLYLLAQLDW